MEIFQDPWVLIPTLILPVVIILLAKQWKKIKDMKAGKPTSASDSTPST